jgi:uncharacterized protein YyaL (SSP411 family)
MVVSAVVALSMCRVCHGEPSTAAVFTRGTKAIELYSTSAERPALRDALTAARELSSEVMNRSLGRHDADEIISYARFCSLVSDYTGDTDLKRDATRMLQHVSSHEEALSEATKKALSLVEHELHSEPVRVTVVGSKGDQRAQALWREVVQLCSPRIRREWWDRREGPLLFPDRTYPSLSAPAAFICYNKKCSLPLYKPREVPERIEEFMGKPGDSDANSKF